MKYTAAERVRLGALLMDVTKPGWAEEVDLDTLDMSKGGLCVAGQNDLSWYDLNLALVGRTSYDVAGTFSGFDDEWVEEIKARRVISGSSVPAPITFAGVLDPGDGALFLNDGTTLALLDDCFVLTDSYGDSATVDLDALQSVIDRARALGA